MELVQEVYIRIVFKSLDSYNLFNLSIKNQSSRKIIEKAFSETFGDEISIRRKVAEAVVAAELERSYTKDQILEYYINSIYWGSGAYGLPSASL